MVSNSEFPRLSRRDLERHQAVEKRLIEVLHLFNGRLPAFGLAQARGLLDAGECGEALEQLAIDLSEFDVPLRDSERADLLDLAHKMASERTVKELSYCPRLADGD